MNPAIITAAVTGSIHTPSMSPHLPSNAQQIVEDAVRAAEAGAAVASGKPPKSGSKRCKLINRNWHR